MARVHKESPSLFPITLLNSSLIVILILLSMVWLVATGGLSTIFHSTSPDLVFQLALIPIISLIVTSLYFAYQHRQKTELNSIIY